MKKKTFFSLLTVLWLFNAGIALVSLYLDYRKSSGPVPPTGSMILAHGLYLAAALVAAVLTWKHRSDK